MAMWRRAVSEAHRRSLWQVLGMYLMASWLGYEVVLGLVEGVGLPAWLPGAVLVLFVIGLPIVLATAIVQEGLPGAAAGTGARSSETLDPTLFPDAKARATEPAESNVVAPLTRVLTWRRAVGAGIGAFAFLGLITAGWLTLRVLGVGPMASLLAAAELEANDRILIAEFDSRGADTTLAAVVTDAFRIDFARSTLVRSVTPAEVQEALRRMDIEGLPRMDAELVRQIAVREGISAYVTGEVSAAGSAYLVSVRLIATASGEVLAAMRERARNEDDLIGAVDRLSVALRERTGESLRTIRRAEPLAKVTTSSLEALQYYTQGMRASSWEGDPERARERYEQAIRLDTAFAAAHRGLAIGWYNAGDTERSIEAAERALRFAERLSESDVASTRASLHLTRGEFASAAAELERVVAINERSFAALNNLGIVYEAMGDPDRAGEYYRRSVLADTGRFFAYTNLGEHLAARGRFDEAEQAFRDAVLRAPNSPWATGSLAVIPYLAGNVNEAETRLRSLLANTASTRGVQERAGWFLYGLLRAQGRFAEADAFAAAAVAPMTDPTADLHIALAQSMSDVLVFGRPDAAQRRLGRVREAAAGVDGIAFVLAAEACAWGGDAACAREYLERAGSNGVLKPWSSQGVRSAHAALALAERDYARASQIARDVDRLASCFSCEAFMLGRIHAAMNQPDSAAVQYERHVAARSMDRVEFDFVLPTVHEWLAQYYEDRGDTSTATRHYARIMELWQNADPELQPRVAAAQRRLALMQPDR